ncbi:hypothetical protein NNO07_06080 [Pseudomonas resinovorans]|uniref:RelA/SpoT domain-containing protein n=1 Tax=Metapseudomonas resinovorans TaxID=53412 RepID=A0ABT4Y1F2_METRE|nr:hypothetical protein [Pseudomonas resinovorans]MDA8482631.1 hypothetical protein [Pseudomonas resinovorans]
MNELEFRQRWGGDKHIYSAWGEFIVESMTGALIGAGKNLDVFLKAPAKFRLKDDDSLVDKAFYRGKNYQDPYGQIEDKVGVRFVVLLLDDISDICNLIQSSDGWKFDACKHFDEDRRRDPLLFTYQSVHYVLRPSKEFVYKDITIPEDTPCEVQVRTLLQHAHAELTHDAIYKAKRTVQPEVHRTVAKSMALIETTDEFFSLVTRKLNYGPLQEFQVIERLDSIYSSLIGLSPHTHKSSIVIWDEFESIVDGDLVDNVRRVIDKYPAIADIIRDRYSKNVFYQQGTIFFVYWMLWRRKQRLLAGWPFSKEMLETLANDIGVSLSVE